MTECNNTEGNTVVCLFDESQESELKNEDNFFQDKLDKTDIYNKEDEEIYIATSPSFSATCTKQSIVEFYDSHDSLVKKEIRSTDIASSCDDQLKCDAAFSSDISNDSHSVEYPELKTSADTYPVINNVEGQSFFISSASDYTQLNNLGIELSKGYFYVLSPMGNGSALMRTPNDETLTQVDSQTLLAHNLNQTKEMDDQITPRETEDTVKSSICGSNSHNLRDYHHETENITVTQNDMNNSAITPTSEFDHLSNDYHVSFINGIPDSPAKERQNITWHRVSPTQESSEKRNDNPHSLLMKYDNDTKMEVPVIHGQPYLQVALVNDMDSSTTNEFVSTDQILGVTVPIPEVFSCKWDGCGTHTLTNQDLVKHVNQAHILLDRTQHYTCHWKGCVREGRPFDARYKMVIHFRTHTGEKPYDCPVKDCESAFSRIENMKIHMRSHTGEKPYPCQYEGCDKTFANSSDRFKHGRTHKEKKPYRCLVTGCDKSYTDPSSLRKHRKRHAAGTMTISRKLTIT